MTESTPPPATVPDILPWENPGLGFGARLTGTLKLLILRPVEGFRRMPVHAEFLMPLMFAVLMVFVGTLFSFAWEQVIPTDQLFGGGQSQEEVEDLPSWMQNMEGWGKSPFLLVASPFLAIAMCFINSLVVHFFLMLFKGAGTTYWGTYRVVCYSLGTASVAAIVPACGSFVQPIWGIVLIILGLQTVHRTTSAKAVFAVLVPFAVMCLCFAGVMTLLMIPFMESAGG